MGEVVDPGEEYPVQSYAMGTAVYARRENEILVLKRAVGAMAGSWYLPGGAVDPGETLEACAARELREETALCPTSPLVLIGLVPMHIYDRDMLIVGYACECADGEVVLSAEHSDHRWVDPQRFREESFSEENVRRIEEADSRVGAIVRGIQRDLDRYLAWRSSEQKRALHGPFELLAGMTRAFADTLDIERTCELTLATIAGELGAEAGSLWLLDDTAREITCQASVGPENITGLNLPAGEGIVGRAIRENTCRMILDVTGEPDFARSVDERSGFVTRSLLCAAMSVKDEALGAIELVNKIGSDGRFAPEDAHLLQALASSAALSIKNARMARALVEHERVQRELELAAEIQRNLLPSPRPAPFPLFGINLPARTVSGDFFDILPLEDGRIAFCLGDVAGKGMNAALLMVKTGSLYRCLAKTSEGPGQVLSVLNRELCETSTRGYFVTMAAGTYDPKEGTVVLANAGHEPALCHAVDGEFTSVDAGAPPLGIVAEAAEGESFPEVEIRVGRGLYLFSDGLTEACRKEGGALGPEGVKELIGRFADRPLAERLQAIVAEVGQCELRDDLTLLGISAVPEA